MSPKKKYNYIFLSKVILITLLIVLCVRAFLIEPYTVSSMQMETYLAKGDRILIDKTAYGIRMPMTVLSIPFTFDNIFGVRSYSTAIEIPYTRVFEKKVSRKDVILFNNPTETDKPLDKRNLLLSRCVALPGDTICVQNGIFLINNQRYVASPDVLEEYITKSVNEKEIKNIMEEQDIPFRDFRRQSDTLFMRLNKLEAFILNDMLPDSVPITNKVDTTQTYRFLVPSKGEIINIDNLTLVLYKQLIVQEQGKKAQVKDDKLFIDGGEQKKYIFQDDYYWALSDNTLNAVDSRTLGFIPFKNIIGKAHTIWYSAERNGFCFLSLSE